ncbi:kinase [Mesorhizobium sp. M8A.F.Ca.ET.173.01.1.1]|nr:kinase [Mesorhizobium sp. M8A.F.Ca.ET.173.01.1.1]
MAVFTDFTESERDQIANAYRLGPLTSVIGIADGDVETTFLFRSPRGDFIVTLFENGAEPLDLERAFQTMEALAAVGIPCPATVRTEEGAATIMVSGKLAAVVGFVPGSLPSDATVEKCRALGVVAAQIHDTLRRPARAASAGLPRGPIHGALTRDNVFFLGSAVSGVINFRLRHDDVLIFELARIMAHWTMAGDGRLNDVRAKALLAGYESARPLSDAERQALPAFLMAASAAFFAEHGGPADVEVRAHATFHCAQKIVGAGR